MGTRRRTARQFQLEAMEPRWTPGGAPGGVLGDRMASQQVQVSHIGEEIPQVRVSPLGGRGGMSGEFAHTQLGGQTGIGRGVSPTPLGGRTGIGGEV